ncbi:Phox domain-containing protein [Acrasis kona]|uniref:Phox domain-containing protein n=1 Tax=Acrasis kona TaxID=1008807 RepID=A0AAW2ZG15_9EUKA
MQFVPVPTDLDYVRKVALENEKKQPTKVITQQTAKSNKERIEQIAKSYNIKMPTGLPTTEKKMVMVIGDQSSGKSSFINYIFGNLEVREVAARAMDSHFTILESVDEEEFSSLVGASKYQDKIKKHQELVADGARLSPEWLYERHQSRDNDPRRHIVWVDLEVTQIEERYKHFLSEVTKHSFHNIVKCVIVNNRFTFGTDVERENENGDVFRPLCRDLIVLDTPGFNDEFKKEKIETNIDFLGFFYNRSDVVFCMTSVDHLLSIGNVLLIVEMSMMSKEHRTKVIEHITKGYSFKDALDMTLKVAGVASYFYTPIKPVVKGVQFLVNKSESNKESHSQHHDNDPSTFLGPSQFSKLYFLMNKIDCCSDNIEHSYFELGCAIGRNFNRLPLPLSSQVFAIGCPMEQRRRVIQIKQGQQVGLSQLKIGHLGQVEAKLQILREDKHEQVLHVKRIGEAWKAIQQAHDHLPLWDKHWTKRDSYNEAFRIVKQYPSLMRSKL